MPLIIQYPSNEVDAELSRDFSLSDVTLLTICKGINTARESIAKWRELEAALPSPASPSQMYLSLYLLYFQIAAEIKETPFVANQSNANFYFNIRKLFFLQIINAQIDAIFNVTNFHHPIVDSLQQKKASVLTLTKSYLNLLECRSRAKTNKFAGIILLLIAICFGVLALNNSVFLLYSGIGLAIPALSLCADGVYRELFLMDNLRLKINTGTRLFTQEITHQLQTHPTLLELRVLRENNPHVEDIKPNHSLAQHELSFRLTEDLKTSNDIPCVICHDDDSKFNSQTLKNPPLLSQETQQLPVYTLNTTTTHFSGPYHLFCIHEWETSMSPNNHRTLLDPKSGSHDVAQTPRRKHFELFRVPIQEVKEEPEHIGNEECRITIWNDA